MNRRRIAGIGIAGVLAGLGAVGLVSWANSAHESAEAQLAQTAVVIVDNLIPKGADAATIKAGTHEGTVQRQSLAPGALTSETQIGTQVAVTDLYPGDQLVKNRLATKADNGLPSGTVEYGLKLHAEAAVGGLVKAGDTVDVFLVSKPENTQQTETYATFASVPVTNVLTAAATTDENGAVKSDEYVVTLALTAEQSDQVIKADVVWLGRPVVK